MKSNLFIAALILGAVSIIYLQTQSHQLSPFQQWKQTYGISFDETEENYRRIIFQKNLQKILKHNADKTQTYKMGINQFTIYSEQQFKQRFLGQNSIYKRNDQINVERGYQPTNIDIDWTTKGGVSRVKNQGQCGSCWAFASVASCQSWALLQKKTVDLSQQQLVDCSASYGNHGCNGGSRSMALRYIKDHGITSQSEYPYKAVTQTCKKQGGQFHISTYTQDSGCEKIQTALQGRPVAVAVDAGGWSHYSSGVFNNCGKSIDHAVLLVGVINGVWKIKNSWGASWGEKGFIRLAAGDTCGVCQQPSVYPH